jgi:hypothetical protein
MKAAAGAVLILFISLPIWFYLLYQVLVTVNATPLMWFLYWVYIPATFIGAFFGKLYNKE